MTKRNPLKQYPRKEISAQNAEVSFWLVKIPYDLLDKIEGRRKQLGYNKKVMVTSALLTYLQVTDKAANYGKS